MSVKVHRVSKEFAKQHIFEIAALRIRIFKDFPYIYDGSVDYEVQYLERYFEAPRAAFIMAFDEELSNKIVGVATCLPLAEEAEFIQKPFKEFDLQKDLINRCHLDEIFYFGESLLDAHYRGRGLGHLFFDEREKYALSFPHVRMTTFCAVQRSSDHPLRPENYQPLDHFWKKRGYQPAQNFISEFKWQDIGEATESTKKMQYWTKLWTK